MLNLAQNPQFLNFCPISIVKLDINHKELITRLEGNGIFTVTFLPDLLLNGSGGKEFIKIFKIFLSRLNY